MRRPSRGEAGFTVLEMAISLALLLLCLLLAAQVLEETAQLFAETAGEALDTPVPLVIARIRADVQGSAVVVPIADEDGLLSSVVIHRQGYQIVYRKLGEDLYRTVIGGGSPPGKPEVLWRGVTGWGCRVLDSNLVDLAVTYRRRTTPHSPLPTLPGQRGPLREELTQRMYLLPRGGGLGNRW